MKWTYLLVNLFSVIVPFVFSFHPKIRFNKYFTAFVKANVISAINFLIWDAIFTAKGVWRFNPDYILGIKLYNLPLEEILFFVCIPFACLFTNHVAENFIKIKWKENFERYFVLVFSLMLFVSGIIFRQQLYTSVTFISTTLLLIAVKFYFKAGWLAQFFSVYPVLLIPFFIVNGILTGTGLEQPVVIYNNSENLGIRLFTIPLEDVFYGFELLLLNTFLYKQFCRIKIN